ncbi:MAG TPA: DUF805 domain-containing protein [Gammaproteobacteria bacterium]|jgi:uncharacterized membrane protein YhaH (DUF805 family)/type II secretory pathway pseudopilin PulG|nr:DUF805 domain-containing protein [Gammaproteobacteria bacterium]
MDSAQTADIRFFELNARIGRLRYLAYGLGLALLGTLGILVCVVLTKVTAPLGFAAAVVIYIGWIVMSVAFGVRRLHDMDKSGWWMLLMIVPLVNLGLVIYLLFFPGTAQENRFGEVPPPNSGWVVAGAVAYIALIPIGGILAAIAIPAYQDFLARSQSAEAIQLAVGAEQSVIAYHDQNKTWPTDLSSLYPKNPDGSIGSYSAGMTAVTVTDGTFGIMVAMKQTGVVLPVAGKRVELWTTDGGSSWHCGPASMDPVDSRYLVASCRSPDAP